MRATLSIIITLMKGMPSSFLYSKWRRKNKLTGRRRSLGGGLMNLNHKSLQWMRHKKLRRSRGYRVSRKLLGNNSQSLAGLRRIANFQLRIPSSFRKTNRYTRFIASIQNLTATRLTTVWKMKLSPRVGKWLSLILIKTKTLMGKTEAVTIQVLMKRYHPLN
jgi:hypothetical protein